MCVENSWLAEAIISVCFAVFAAVSAVFPDAHKAPKRLPAVSACDCKVGAGVGQVLFAVLCALYFGP